MSRFNEFQEGDVVWGPDAHHDDDPALRAEGVRPWVVLSTTAYPRQGEEYVCCAITSNLAPEPHRIPLAEADGERPGLRRPGQGDPTTVVCMKHRWIARLTGRLAHRPVARARRPVQSFLAPPRR